jgi:hypothetical protein
LYGGAFLDILSSLLLPLLLLLAGVWLPGAGVHDVPHTRHRAAHAGGLPQVS